METCFHHLPSEFFRILQELQNDVKIMIYNSLIQYIFALIPHNMLTSLIYLTFFLFISGGFVKTKIFDKQDDFDFDIVNCPVLDGDVPRSTSYGVYISQLIGFVRVSSHVDDFNTRNKVFLQQNFSDKDIDIINFVRHFQNFIGGILT